MTQWTVTVGGVPLAVRQDPDGPRFVTLDDRTEPLARIVNNAVDGTLPDLAARVAAGDEVHGPMMWLAPATEEQRRAWAPAWRELGGEEPGPDAYYLALAFSRDRLVVPRPALIEAIEWLSGRPEPPPDASGTDASGPDASGTGTSGLGATGPDAAAASGTDPGPWWELPADDEATRAALTALEAEAAAIDALEASGRPADAVTASAKRRTLLPELDRLGFHTDAGWDRRRRLLGTWGLDTLLGYHSAARQLSEYAAGPARAAAGLAPVATSRDCAVSLDWFRLGHSDPPPAYTETGWTAHCEALLSANAARLSGGSGEIYARQFTDAGPRVLRLAWRTDDGIVPLLLSAALQ
jgi:hypothetical protein